MTNEERALVWEAHVAEWRASGLSQTMFAQQHGLKEVQLGYWIRRCKVLATAPAFLPVGLKTSLEPEVGIKGIYLYSPGGWRVQLPDNLGMAALNDLLRGLP